MVTQHFWNNLKGLSCSLLLLFGTFALLIFSVVLALYILHLPNLWPYLLVLSVCLIGLLSWMQLTAVRVENRIEGDGASPNIISTIPTIAGLLNASVSQAHCPPPPPYCEASLYEVFKPDAGTVPPPPPPPPPSYDEAIKSVNNLVSKTLGLRTYDPQCLYIHATTD